MTRKIRILLTDDHGIVREGLKQLFSLVSDIVVTGEAMNGSQAIELLQATPGAFDLVLLDMTMPGISGTDLIARIRTRLPNLPILVLSMHAEAQIARRALQSGAAGYLTKDCDPETLLAAIRRIAAGGRYILPELAERMVFDADRSISAPHAILTDRELEVLRLLARGRTVNEVADGLFISNKTVSTHKARLMEKMHFETNTDLVRYAVTHKLIE